MAIEYDPRADYYVMLGIEDGATAEDIKTGHRERIRELHPDHGGDSARAAMVNVAREVLGDPTSRRSYDKARRGWFMAFLRDPGMSAFFDGNGRLTAHFAEQQRAQEAEDASAAEARQRAAATAFPSEAERAARHSREWQWGLTADLAWPDVRKALLAGNWLAAIAGMGTALLIDRAIEVHCPAEQLAALDALVGPRQRERKAKLMETIAQALGRQLSKDVEELAAQVRQAGGAEVPDTSPATTSRQHGAPRRNPVAPNSAPRSATSRARPR